MKALRHPQRALAFPLLGILACLVALVVPQLAFATAKWSVQEPPGASESFETRFNAVACPTETVCLAAGYKLNPKTGKPEPLLERWAGSKWSIEAVPLPTGATIGELNGVSCLTLSTESCYAAGSFINAEKKVLPSVASYTLGKWTMAAVPIPVAARGAALQAISCSTGRCDAVGSFTTATVTLPLAEENGPDNTWFLTDPPAPAGATSTSLSGISCVSNHVCTAVGRSLSAGHLSPVIEAPIEGNKWALREFSLPSGTKSSELSGISCPASSNCTAAGEFTSTNTLPMAQKWNGSAWLLEEPSLIAEHAPYQIRGVSCGSTSACVIAGSSSIKLGITVPFVDRWTGTAWLAEEPPSPSGGEALRLTGVSCTTASSCTAVGYFRNKASGKWLPLAERYQ